MILAPFLGLLWTYSMFINPFSATILLAILLGVLVKGKIDNLAHLSGLLIIFPLLIFFRVELLIIPLFFLAGAATLDEIGNDVIDKEFIKTKTDFWSRFVVLFFDQRWMLKSALLFLSVIGLIPFVFFIAMVFFDYSYLAVRLASEIKQEKRENIDQINVKNKSILLQKTPSKN